MYIKKKDREIINFIDRSLILPKDWERFLSRQKTKHNLIIKSKDTYFCTNCKSYFKANSKINEYCKCTSCKNIYLVKSNKLKSYTFKKDIAIFDKVETFWVERCFRLETKYSDNNVSSTWYEWGRNIYDNTFHRIYELFNDNAFINLSGCSLYNKVGSLNSNWKMSNSYYSPNGWINEFKYYPGNIKKLLSKEPQYKYSQLWILVKHVEQCDLYGLLKNYNSCIEILTKAKLYNLALRPDKLYDKKLTKDFNIHKENLPFIQKYNLTYEELEVMSTLKAKNINLIKKTVKLQNYHTLNEIINIEQAFKKTDLNEFNSQEYYDYLIISRLIGRNMKDKKILYPSHIIPAHNEVMKEYEIQKDQKINSGIKHRYEELKKNIYQNKQYIITPADSMSSLIDESKQQNNCVRTYAERYAKKECDIYFMRKTSDPAASLVTVEVKNKEVVQQRTRNNESTNKSQMRFLKEWEKMILKGVKNET